MRESRAMRHALSIAAVIAAAACTGGRNGGDDDDDVGSQPYQLPAQVSVQPLFFVASDQPAPGAETVALLATHLAWSQTRFGELLGGPTFTIAGEPDVIAGALTLAEYQALPNTAAPEITAELLAH